MNAGGRQAPVGLATDHNAQVVLAEIKLLRDLGRNDRQIAGVLERQGLQNKSGVARWRPAMVRRVLASQGGCGRV